jgi:hypothetical protein
LTIASLQSALGAASLVSGESQENAMPEYPDRQAPAQHAIIETRVLCMTKLHRPGMPARRSSNWAMVKFIKQGQIARRCAALARTEHHLQCLENA